MDPDHLRSFGTKVCVLDKSPNKDKFAPRSREGKFVGYPRESKGYRVWIPKEKRVVIARDVKFFDEFDEEKDDTFRDFEVTETSLRRESTRESVRRKTSGNQSDDSRSRSTSQADEPMVSVQTLNNENRRGRGRPRLVRSGQPGRPRKVYSTVIDDEEEPPTPNLDELEDDVFAEYAGIGEVSIEEAINGEDRKEWEEAILSEIKSLVKNDTWTITNKKSCKNVIGCRYVLTHKHDPEGLSDKRKARLVAKGYSQRFGIDYHHTFAPVARLESIRLLAALSAEMNMKIHQLDITTAYLNGKLDEVIIMELPAFLNKMLKRLILQEGRDTNIGIKARNMLRSLEAGGDACRLNKALYGLRQAGRQWNTSLNQKLTSLGLKQTIGEPCMYHAAREESIIIVLIYVDDILIASQSSQWIEEIKLALAKDFELKNFGLARHCLGLEILQAENRVTLSQRDYINEVLRRFKMTECHAISTPLEVGARLTNDGEDKDGEEYNDGKYQRPWPYRELIGALMYLAVATRPDIANTVAKLAQFCNSPKEIHWKAAKRVLRYLRGTVNIGLTYEQTKKSIIGYSDSDWGGCVIDRRSFSGYVYLMGEAAISWKSQKQQTVALSSTEAEYVSVAEAVKEAIYLRSLLRELNLDKFSNITLFVDNQGAIHLATNPIFHSRAKHIDIKCHFVREALVAEKLIVKYIPTEKMVADVLTKALPNQKHVRFMNDLGLRIARA